MSERLSLAGPSSERFAPWAISKASSAVICPKQFSLKYVHRAPAENVHSGNNVGTAAHKVLELRLKGKTAREALAQALVDHPLTTQEQEDLQSLLDAVEGFMKKWDSFCKANKVVNVLTEQQWAIDSAGAAVSFFSPQAFFRGVIDLAAVTADNDFIVIDHKSGHAKDIFKEESYRRQIDSYLVMALTNLKSFAGARGAIHFLQGAEHMRIQWMDYVPRSRIETELVPWLFSYIEYAAKKAVEPFPAKPVKPLKGNPRFPCSHCSYRTSCQPYQEMLRAS